MWTWHLKAVGLSHLAAGVEGAPRPFAVESGACHRQRAAFPRIKSESSQAREMASAQPEAWFAFLFPHSSTVVFRKPAWPGSENSRRLLGVLGGRLPSSEVLRQLPVWSSSSEPATRKSDKGPGTSCAKYWASSDSETREACGGRQGGAQRRTRSGPLNSNYFQSCQANCVLIHGHSKQLWQ